MTLHFSTSHIIPNPAGTFSVKGTLPATCVTQHRPPRAADVIAGRVGYDGLGSSSYLAYSWSAKTFQTRQEAEAAVIEGGGTLCDCCR